MSSATFSHAQKPAKELLVSRGSNKCMHQDQSNPSDLLQIGLSNPFLFDTAEEQVLCLAAQ